MSELVVRFSDGAREQWGLLRGDAPVAAGDVVRIAPIIGNARTTADIIAAFDADGLETGNVIEVEARSLLSPITHDVTIFAQGLNYQDHAAEAQHAKRSSNLIFSKASSSLSGPYADIIRPQEVQLLDYEVEFGIVTRRDLGEGDTVEDAAIGDAVAGIVLANDVSARDIMFGTSFMQWFRGKGYRTFCPAGPVLWLLKPSEVEEALGGIHIELKVNGEVRQSATSSQLIWKPAETLSYIASTMDMKRGDMVLTGTPGGVTAHATPRLIEIFKEHLLADQIRTDEIRIELSKGRPFLQPGDMVIATLKDGRGRSLGGLANRIADAA
jgi:2-keto-4-pentenoate hydratase/2-oxohepta-3-ene-1,7-dioic acid hydratase in catechol pathway